jgi:regulator of protease activity HflC (stomatin/prohibitin superfamily)
LYVAGLRTPPNRNLFPEKGLEEDSSSCDCAGIAYLQWFVETSLRRAPVQSGESEAPTMMGIGIPGLFLIFIIAIYLINSVKILREYERGVVFRLGRILSAPKGPGVILIFRPFDQMVRVSLRQEVLEVPPQDIITRDNVTLKVNAVITLKVIDPSRAVIEVMNYVYQTSQFAQTTLRSVLGEVELDELLSRRESLNQRIQSIIDEHTTPWGVKVVSVAVKQVDLPESMLRAIAKQAEAEREKRAKVIHAEGEFSAAQRLVDAAALLATQPMTLQLRYLQTLTEIGVEKNTTIVFPLPIEMMTLFNKMGDKLEK